MECKLYRETSTSLVFAINKAFYLIIPKLRIKPNIEIVIDCDIEEKLENYFNISNIAIIRRYSLKYFDGVNKENLNSIKDITNSDLSLTKKILSSNRIDFNDEVIITTPFEEIKKMYNISDSLSERQKRINELIKLKNELIESSSQSRKKANNKRKTLNNGHSLLDYHNEGFANTMLLSLITIIISIIVILSVINLTIVK